jgi:anti-sigma-K factor RskA
MTDPRAHLCSEIDELAAGYALGAVDPHEERGISAHLTSCAEPHAEARDYVAAAAALPSVLDPITPSAALRDRLMSTVARTPQDHRLHTAPVAESNSRLPSRPRRPWWQLSPLPSALAAAAFAAAIGLGAWGLTLNSDLRERDAALRAVASADAIYAASGEAGSGWLIQTGDEARFVATELADVPSDRLYELWVIDDEGNAMAAGTFTDTDLTLVNLERGLEGASVFAVTVEHERVDRPTSDPVIVAEIDA